jgi:acyl-CoA reductase-like NAD-dependent aldehyde dehydrogenase
MEAYKDNKEEYTLKNVKTETKVKQYYNYINGEWVTSVSGETFTSINPANTKQILAAFAKSTEEDYNNAIDAAAVTFSKWRNTPSPIRGEIILKAAKLLEEREEEFVHTVALEVGKTLAEARGEVKRTIAGMRMQAAEGTRLTGETIPSQQPGVFAYTIKEPLGVVGIITPWNFPLGIAAWKISPALVAGNTIVFKPASNTALVSVMFVELLIEAGVPEGVLNFITGPGGAAGHAFSQNPKLKAVSFTGSTEVGTKLGNAIQQRGARMQAEMGGKNPFVILKDADLDLAVDHIILGGFGECGQRCTATSRVIIEREVSDLLIEKLIAKTKNIMIGNPLDPETTMGVVIDEGQVRSYEYYVDLAQQEGANLIYGGSRLMHGEYTHGFFVEPTILTGVTPEMRISQEEVFGPVLSIMLVDSYEQALEWSNNVPYGLSSSIYTNDLNKANDFVRNIESGVTHVNLPSTYSEAQYPFGGIKCTTIGPREQGRAGIEFYTFTRTVYTKP